MAQPLLATSLCLLLSEAIHAKNEGFLLGPGAGGGSEHFRRRSTLEFNPDNGRTCQRNGHNVHTPIMIIL